MAWRGCHFHSQFATVGGNSSRTAIIMNIECNPWIRGAQRTVSGGRRRGALGSVDVGADDGD